MLRVAFRTSEVLSTFPTTAAVCARYYHHHSLLRTSTAVFRRVHRPGPISSRAYFHRTCQRSTASPNVPRQKTSFQDPERPDLYYHLVDPPTPASASQPAFALSFLPTLPEPADSSAIIGWLPAALDEQNSGQGQGEAGLNDFVENGDRFVVLSQVGKTDLAWAFFLGGGNSKVPRSSTCRYPRWAKRRRG